MANAKGDQSDCRYLKLINYYYTNQDIINYYCKTLHFKDPGDKINIDS